MSRLRARLATRAPRSSPNSLRPPRLRDRLDLASILAVEQMTRDALTRGLGWMEVRHQEVLGKAMSLAWRRQLEEVLFPPGEAAYGALLPTVPGTSLADARRFASSHPPRVLDEGL